MKILKIFLILFIISFLALFFVYQNGYYENITREKISLTNQKIEEFEEDIKDKKDISLETYLEKEKNYATKTSKITLNVSNKLENIIDSSIKFIFKKISQAVE